MVKQYPVFADKEDYTFEEYLVMEEQAEYKSEYQDGKILPIESATDRHAEIASNTTAAFKNALRSKNKTCKVYDSSLKVYFEEYNHGAYPDGSIICGEREFYKGKRYVIVNPLLIIEVLSPSTSSYDRGEKFMKYRSLPAFKEYMLVSQEIAKVETWYKMEENVWRISHAEGMDSTIHLFSLDVDLPLRDIYYLVDFSETT